MFKFNPLEITNEVQVGLNKNATPIAAPKLKEGTRPVLSWGSGIWEFVWQSYPGILTEVIVKESGTKKVVYEAKVNCTWCLVELLQPRKSYLVLLRSLSSCGLRQSAWVEFSFSTGSNE